MAAPEGSTVERILGAQGSLRPNALDQRNRAIRNEPVHPRDNKPHGGTISLMTDITGAQWPKASTSGMGDYGSAHVAPEIVARLGMAGEEL